MAAPKEQTKSKSPVLTDAGGMGGLIAQDGFDYQIFDAIVRLPAWLMLPGFESVMIEAQEDFEARFFAPHAPHGHVLERYQGKKSELAKVGLVEVLGKFSALDQAYPNTTRRYVLVTPSLGANLRWLPRLLKRVEHSRPFYSPFATIGAANDNAVVDRCQREFGVELGAFTAQCVDIDLRDYPTRDQARAQFSLALQQEFGGEGYLPSRVARAFDALFSTLQSKRGQHIGRQALISILQEALGELPAALAASTLLVKLVQTEADATSAAIEIDTRPFLLGEYGIPAPAVWANGLIEPLSRLARWARTANRSQIALEGQYRLTTALVAGYSLRSAIGFELAFYNRDTRWHTSTHPQQDTLSLSWEITEPTALHNGRLLVVVGIVRPALPAVQATYSVDIVDASLTMQLRVGIPNSEAAQQGVAQIKQAVDRVVNQLRPSGLDLFYVGPAAFAVALGHRWNKLPSTQLYEFHSETGTYQPTAVMG